MRKTTPFSISPNPALLYITPSINSALQKVRHVVDYRQGLTAIMGDNGHGKSTILRLLWNEMLERDDVKSIALLSPSYNSVFAFLKAIAGEFGLQHRRSQSAQENELREFLGSVAEEDKTAVVFVDEAQKLPGNQLELVRTLLNYETAEYKLIQIVLVAQLELHIKLLDESKKALRSRLFVPSILSPLSPEETRAMIGFRCQQAGEANPFSAETVERIYNQTGGVPREVLKVCQIAWVEQQKQGVKGIPPEWIEPLSSEVSLNG